VQNLTFLKLRTCHTIFDQNRNADITYKAYFFFRTCRSVFGEEEKEQSTNDLTAELVNGENPTTRGSES
jgi:hypothetical protein